MNNLRGRAAMAFLLSSLAPMVGHGQEPTSETSEKQLRPLNEVLQDALIHVGGAYVCDRSIEMRNKRRFLRRYSQRINSLESSYRSWHGEDPPLYRLATCRGISNYKAFTKHANEAFNSFDYELRELELLYAERPIANGHQ